MIRIRFAACVLAAHVASGASGEELRDAVDRAARAVEPQVIAWRRDLHEHPELGNREVRTAALVAKRLRKLGLDVRTKVAHTGVVAVLRGTAERPVVALRADMSTSTLTVIESRGAARPLTAAPRRASMAAGRRRARTRAIPARRFEPVRAPGAPGVDRAQSARRNG